MTALKEKYRSEIVPQLQSELGLKNVMAVPRISKITLNMGGRRLRVKSPSSPSRVNRLRDSRSVTVGRLVAK